MKKLISVLLLICLTALCLASCMDNKQAKYDEAMALIGEGKFTEAYEIFKGLGDYNDSETIVKRFRYVPTDAIFTSEKDGTTESAGSINIYYNDNNLPKQIVENEANGDRNVADYAYDAKGNVIQ